MSLIKLIGLTSALQPPNKRASSDPVPLVKDVLIDSLKFSKASTGKEAIILNRLADKLFDAQGDTAIEYADFLTLKEAVSRNPAGYFAWCHAQAMEKVLEWEQGAGKL